MPAQHRHRAEGHLVGVAEDRRRPWTGAAEQRLHRGLAVGSVAVAGGEHVLVGDLDTGRPEHVVQAAGPQLPDRRVGLRRHPAVEDRRCAGGPERAGAPRSAARPPGGRRRCPETLVSGEPVAVAGTTAVPSAMLRPSLEIVPAKSSASRPRPAPSSRNSCRNRTGSASRSSESTSRLISSTRYPAGVRISLAPEANSLKYHDRSVGSTIPTVWECPLASELARCEAEKSSRTAVSMIRSRVDGPTPEMPRSARDTVPLFTPASRATSAIVVRRVGACLRVAITQCRVPGISTSDYTSVVLLCILRRPGKNVADVRPGCWRVL